MAPSIPLLTVTLLAALFALLGSFTASAEPLQLPAPVSSEYRIAIHCSRGVLQLWRHTELIREYPIEIGVGTNKQRGGDHRTPIGDYAISWMASRVSNKGHRIVEARSWCRENRFVNAKSGPSLEKLWTNPYGGDWATVMSINYPNERDVRLGRTGDCIHIHADARVQEGSMKKSYGCIHMFPPDAMELYEMVEVGTPVKILP
jgi:hypothetical protein